MKKYKVEKRKDTIYNIHNIYEIIKVGDNKVSL